MNKIIFSILSLSMILTNLRIDINANEENQEVISYESSNQGLNELIVNGDFEKTEKVNISEKPSGPWLDYELWEEDLKVSNWLLQKWQPTQDSSHFTGEVINEDDNSYVRLNKTAKNGTAQMFFKQVDMPVKAGVNYRVSLDYMINSLDGSSIKVRIESVDSKGQIKSKDMNLPKNDTWENFNFDIVAGADVVKFNLIIVSPSNTSSDISLDNVSITYNDNSVNSIQMDTTPIKLREGAFTFLNAIALPETADNRKLHYSSDDEAVASVDATGRVTANSVGKANITVAADADQQINQVKSIEVIAKDEPLSPNIIKNGNFDELEKVPSDNPNNGIDYGLWSNNNKPVDWNFQKYPNSAPTDLFKADVLETDNNNRVQLNVSNNSATQAFFKTRVSGMPDYGTFELTFDIKTNSISDDKKPFIRIEDSWSSGTIVKTTDYEIDFDLNSWTTLSLTHTLQKNGSANIILVFPFGSTADVELDNFSWSEIDKAVTSIELNQEDAHIKINERLSLVAIVLPENATDKTLLWESSDKSVATVDSLGKVVALAKGKTTITATSIQNPEVTVSKDIFVHDGDIIAEYLTVNDLESEVGLNNKRFLTYEIYPLTSDNVENIEVEWSVSDDSIAKIDGDVITFIKTGEVTITVKDFNSDLSGEKVVTVKDTTYSDDFKLMKDRFISRIIGNEATNSSSDKYVNDYIKKAEDKTSGLLETLDLSDNRDKLWVKSSASNNITFEFQNIRALAVSFAMPGSKYYEDTELYKIIIDAVDFMLENSNFGKKYSGNWWDYQVGGSQALADIMILLDDYNYSGLTESYAKVLSIYNYDVLKQINGATNTGANLSDSALVVLAVAIVRSDDNRLAHIKQHIPSLFKKGTTGDGMYNDGSLIQHGNHAYNGSYGGELIKGSGIILSILNDTEWEVNEDNTSIIGHFFETIEKGFIPMVHNGHVLDFVSGRDVSRPPQRTFSSPTQKNGSNYIASLLTIAEFAPAELSLKIKEHVKYWYENSKDYFDYLSDPRDFDQLRLLQVIINDESIEAKIDNDFKAYNMMARALYRSNKFTATVTMTNKRIANYESINNEHLKGWNTGDGSLYVYNNELDNFNESYRPTVDYNRIPGTTTDTKDLVSPARNDGKVSPGIDWASGTTNGRNGLVSTMVDKSLQNQIDVNGVSPDLKATKSYFFIDGKIVAIGSDISGTTDNTLETIIENRIITKSGNGQMLINGKEINELENFDVNDNDWAYLRGKDKDTSFGYVFLEGGNIDAGQVTRTGQFSDINKEFNIPDVFTEDFFQIRYNHGKVAKDETYAYVMLPGYSRDETKAFAEKSNLTIIKQDSDAHVVYDKTSNTLFANVFKEGIDLDLSNTRLGVETAKLKSTGSFIIENKYGHLTVTLADGTLRDTNVTVELTGQFNLVVNKGDKVSVKHTDDKVLVEFDSKGSQGVQQNAILKLNLNIDLGEAKLVLDKYENIDKGLYTEISVQELEESVEELQAIINLINKLTRMTIDQESVDTAVAKVRTALENLELKEVEPKPEEPKPEEPKPEEPKPEEPKPEKPKPEELKKEEPKPEDTKSEEPKQPIEDGGASDSGAEVVPPTGVQSNTYIFIAILGTSLLTLLRLKRKKLKI